MINKKSLFSGIIIGVMLTFVGIRFFEFITANNIALNMPMTVNGKISRIYNLIDEHFIYETDPALLEYGIYAGIIEMLGDRYSGYYSKELMETVNERYSGYYAGIGVLVSLDTDSNQIVLIHIFEDSPAQKAGLLPGDIVTAIDGLPIAGKDFDIVGTLVRGEAGSLVTLTITREDEDGGTIEPFDVTITRDYINTPNIYGQMLEDAPLKGIGYIQITHFDNIAAEDFKQEFAALEQEGLNALIIDLRDNTGGALRSLVEVADFLVDADVLLYYEDKNGKREYMHGKPDKVDVPLVVLINGQSASAAELLAAILAERGDAVLVGETTFGKGSITTTFPLPDGSAVNLSTALFYSPNGVTPHKVGVTPHVFVQSGEGEEDLQFEAALELAVAAVE